MSTPTPLSREIIAAICHDANASLRLSLGESSSAPWAEAPENERVSALKGVDFIANNPQAGPDASHLSWLKEKEATGWKYGPEKNPDLKEHPCMVPYDQLPAAQQAKDHLFKAVAQALLPFTEGYVAPKPAVQTPTVGRAVYYQAPGSADGVHPGAHRAATITQVLEDGFVSLAVLNPQGIHFNQRVPFGGPGQPSTWFWPPRV